jgi:hypothetical protein
MPTRLHGGLLVLGSLALVGFPPPTCGLFRARLTGEQAVPPVETRASGAALFFYTEEVDVGLARAPERVIHYELSAQGLEHVSRADVHCGREGANGPVAVLLYGLDPAGTALHDADVRGTILASQLLPVEDSAACPGGIASVADLAVRMKTGSAYVDVHSEAHPDGEIRGNIVEALRGRSVACGPEIRCHARHEICVRREPVGPAVVFACEPVPPGCRSERTCSCAGAALCTGAFDVCHDVPERDTISCECPQCQ